MNSQSGLTLIELMIVLAIIGIISSLGLNKYGQYKSSIALMEARKIAKQVLIARASTDGEGSIQITGMSCPDCECRQGKEDTQLCKDNLTSAYKRLGYSSYPKTPWGKPYFFDNNEDEHFWKIVWGSKCVADSLAWWDYYHERVEYILVLNDKCKQNIDPFNGDVIVEGDDRSRSDFVYLYPSFIYKPNGE